jgi:orotidine-5'-phosphate decarboxylase
MNKDIALKERIIVALDVDHPQKARAMVKRCESHVGFFKVGLQLFMADYFNTVEWILDRGHQVMLDLKFYDIPETVRLAVEQVNDRGVSLLTVHGNDPIIRAAVGARGTMKILAVTVLTSFGEEDMGPMGLQGTLDDLVLHRARRALEIGCDGIVSSGLEAERLRTELGSGLLIVTPGIRPAATAGAGDDQTRVVTAGMAVGSGADHLVVGRPITRADDPVKVIEAMQAEIVAAVG